MANFKKRAFPLFMALVMIISMLPVNAFAAEGETRGVEEWLLLACDKEEVAHTSECYEHNEDYCYHTHDGLEILGREKCDYVNCTEHSHGESCTPACGYTSHTNDCCIYDQEHTHTFDCCTIKYHPSHVVVLGCGYLCLHSHDETVCEKSCIYHTHTTNCCTIEPHGRVNLIGQLVHEDSCYGDKCVNTNRYHKHGLNCKYELKCTKTLHVHGTNCNYIDCTDENCEHTDATCYKCDKIQDDSHEHGDACYISCTAEGCEHTSADCYTCGKVPHTAEQHTKDCPRSCGMIIHTHADSETCSYEKSEGATYKEGCPGYAHTHSTTTCVYDDCQNTRLHGEHNHDDDCYIKCTAEGCEHTDAACYSCGNVPHTHDETCARTCGMTTEDLVCQAEWFETVLYWLDKIGVSIGHDLDCKNEDHHIHSLEEGCYVPGDEFRAAFFDATGVQIETNEEVIAVFRHVLSCMNSGNEDRCGLDINVSFDGKVTIGLELCKEAFCPLCKRLNDFCTCVEITFAGYGETFDAEKVVKVKNGEAVLADAVPNTDVLNYVFLGWYDENGTLFSTETRFTEDTTYTAKYRALKEHEKIQGTLEYIQNNFDLGAEVGNLITILSNGEITRDKILTSVGEYTDEITALLWAAVLTGEMSSEQAQQIADAMAQGGEYTNEIANWLWPEEAVLMPSVDEIVNSIDSTKLAAEIRDMIAEEYGIAFDENWAVTNADEAEAYIRGYIESAESLTAEQKAAILALIRCDSEEAFIAEVNAQLNAQINSMIASIDYEAIAKELYAMIVEDGIKVAENWVETNKAQAEAYILAHIDEVKGLAAAQKAYIVGQLTAQKAEAEKVMAAVCGALSGKINAAVAAAEQAAAKLLGDKELGETIGKTLFENLDITADDLRALKSETAAAVIAAIEGGALTAEQKAALLELLENGEDGVMIIADWLWPVHTITFNTDGGSAINAITGRYGDKITAPAAPTKEGYTFSKWDTVIPATMPAEDMTITAQWTINKYAVKFVNEDGAVLQSGEVEYGAIPAYTGETPAKTATAQYTYAFAGWTPEIASVTGDVTYTATFTETLNKYTVTFVDEFNATTTSTVNYGSSAVEPVRKIVASHKFIGWFEENATEAWNFKTDKVTGNVTLYAKYEINKYTVTFVDYDNSQIESKVWEYGETPVAPEVPERTGYNFIGWDKEVASVTGNATYTAQYAEKRANVTGLIKIGKIVSGSGVATGINAGEGTIMNARVLELFPKNKDTVMVEGVDYDSIVATPGKAVMKGVTYTNGKGSSENFYILTSGATAVACKAEYHLDYQAEFYNTVKFVNHDGKVLKTEAVLHGSAATAPEKNPTRTGWTFIGWDVDFSKVEKSITVTALYTQDKYTVTFVDEFNATTTSTVNYGSSAIEPMRKIVASHKFIGWFEENATEAWNFKTDKVTGNVTLYAKYEINKYTVTFVDYGNSQIESKVWEYGETPVAPEVPERTGYNFIGWDKEVASVTGNATYTAQYQIQNYAITYNMNGGSGEMETQSVNYGESIALSTNAFTRTGYTFTGWNTDGHGNGTSYEEGQVVSLTKPLTLYAQWKANEYNITFNTNGGELKDWYGYKYTYGVGLNWLPSAQNISRTGYTFSGWMNEDGKLVSSISETEMGDKSFTAQWTPKQYTVTFKDWNGNVLQSGLVAYDSVPTAPADPTRTADNTYTYAFKGWDKEIVKVTGEAVYTATYKSTYIDYTVKFVDYNGDEISKKTYHFGDTVKVPDDPTRTADNTYTYAFKGWDKTVAAQCAGSVTYTATYESTYIDYTVKFVNEDKVISEKSYHFGDTVEVPTAPAKVADNTYTYVFAGWTPELSTVVVGNAEYTATYKSVYKNYTITFVDHEGNEISVTDYHYGDEIVIPDAPEREGYTFIGWGAEIDDVTETVTFMAQYQINQYTITFNSNGGTYVEPIIQDYATAITAPADPTRYAYTFTGWDTEIPATMPAHNMTINAKWVLNTYTVTFTAVGNVIDTQIVEHGSAADAPEEPARMGWEFAGWDVEFDNITSDLTVDAMWIRTTQNIEDEDVPLGGDEGIIIEDEEVPLASGELLNTDEFIAYINGFEDATVRPEALMTRAQFFTIMFRLLNDDFRLENWGTESRFTDVDEDDWFFNEITTCDNIGLLDHYEDETFEPNKNITREEVAYVIAMFIEDAYEGEDALFTDIADSFAFDAINDCMTAGLIGGDSDGTFRPQDTIKRGEVAKIINILLGRDADKLTGDLKNWSDNVEGKWYYEFIRVASNDFDAETFMAIMPEEDYWNKKEKEWAAQFAALASKEETEDDEEIEG